MIELADIEHSTNSQNGEDGIIEYLHAAVKNPNRVFIEIGCGSGGQNNTTALAKKGWTGMVMDRKPARITSYRVYAKMHGFDDRVKAYAMAATRTNGEEVMRILGRRDPDLFSLDIDGPDFHVMEGLMRNCFTPRIVCLEYNATFERRPITVPYAGLPKIPDHFYYGCSVAAWWNLLEPLNYEFVTCDSNGVNCFFVHCATVDMDHVRQLNGHAWLDNARWKERYGTIAKRLRKVGGRPLETVGHMMHPSKAGRRSVRRPCRPGGLS